MAEHYRIHSFKRTFEDWYPSYHLDGYVDYYVLRVEACFNIPDVDPPRSRVSVWGGDDFGMIRDFPNEAAATACYVQLTLLRECLTRKGLEALGFTIF